MNSIYLFDVKYLYNIMAYAASQEIGPQAFSNNYEDIIVLVIDSVLYPYTDYPDEIIYKEITSYGLSIDKAQELLVVLRAAASRMLSAFKSLDMEKFDYQIDINPDYKLEVNISPKPKPARAVTMAEKLSNQVAKDIEDGHWVSESVRRSVGY